MTTIREWLKGKKTYLLAGGLTVAALALLMTGRLNAHTAMTMLLVAAFGFPATFRAALETHQDETLALLEELAVTGAAVASHNLPGAYAAGETVAKMGEALAQQCRQEGAQQ